jgi:hypothetical protein
MDAKIYDDLSTNRYMSIVGFADSFDLGGTAYTYPETRAFLTKLNLDDALLDGDCNTASVISFTVSTTGIVAIV